jgi:hypothetical protein
VTCSIATLGILVAESDVEILLFGRGGPVAAHPGQTGAGKPGGSMSPDCGHDFGCNWGQGAGE